MRIPCADWRGPVLFALLLDAMLVSRAHAADNGDLYDLSLEELMNIKVSTAANLSSSWRSQPGIITLFDSSDMRAMGARSLRDVLLHIPGVSLGMDTQNTVNLVARGNWAFEGKIQYLVNDMPVNDLIYGTFPLPPNFPVSQLERIEVLRGPGSVKYGNSAQLAVIRIYTRAVKETQVAFSTQQSANTLSVNGGGRFDEGQFSVSGSLQDGNWGKGNWIDSQGTSADISTSDTRGGNLAANLNWSGTQVGLFHLQYGMDNIQQYGVYAPTAKIDFRETNFFIAHDFELNEQWQLTPRFGYRDEANWRSSSQAPDFVYDYDVRARALDAQLDSIYQYASDASISVGVYHQTETARAISVDMPSQEYFPPDGELQQQTRAIYANWDLRISEYDLSLGARASHHDYSGSAFTPRIGVTRAEKNWHMKMLYGMAFREPDLQTSNPIFHPATETLKAEQSRVSEIEYGHTLGEKSYLTLSLFDQRIKDAIIYSYEPGYTNNPPIKTRGIDLQYWFTDDIFSLRANASYAKANDDDLLPYDVPNHSGQNMGAANQIANLWLGWKTPLNNLGVNLDLRYVGSRYAQQYLTAMDSIQVKQLAAEKTVNLSLAYSFPAVVWTLGVSNLTDANVQIPQPYNDVSTPFPAGGREYWLRAEITL